MPTLHFNGQTASTFDEQTNMLKNTFFPPPPPADLSDIAGSFYPAPTQSPDIISKSEIMGALQRLKADKAPGPDGISYRILKTCAETLPELLVPLFQACIDPFISSSGF